MNIQRNNISGKNKNLRFSSRINKRFDLAQIDSERRGLVEDFFEYRINAKYSLPYFYDLPFRQTISTEAARRRFFGFDADILRGSLNFDRKLTRRSSYSLRYQFETIKQFNATEDLDNGYFQIGGVTASYFFDNRNRLINPESGNYHSLSTELATPYLLSMDDDDVEVNFIKVQSRNRFYFTTGGITTAVSFAAGWQKNLGSSSDSGGKTSYIPGVKVFRLEGIDNVRGYDADELNRISGTSDISDYVINDQAVFMNLKLELRKVTSDVLMTSAFYDMGKLAPKGLDFNNLKQSVALSFKFLTPVGTLNLDYGIKLKREEVLGKKEQFGRFHLMIGYF